ncbi:MAG: DUF3365 domain-containing protein [Desulfuromonadaceae bacterium]|nr:DUF3365 domain-containing protein [Desulfuromonadaceae bacterium]MDD2855406.1 DUF3365 domain-containing protein [Desulfuromonadaceae bacterium]
MNIGSRDTEPGKLTGILKVIALPVLITMAVAGLIYYALSAFFLSDAEDKIRNVLFSHRGLHHYIQRVMLPSYFKARDNSEVNKSYYSPEILSSSFIVRNMHSFYNEEMRKAGLPEVYYKMASVNPRNPVNMADEFEGSLIRYFNENREVREYRKIINIDGKKYLYYAIPFLETNSNCLKCHGKRQDAPPGLQNLYPGEGGFNEKTGVYRAIESIRMPINDEISATLISTISLSVGIAVMIILFFFNKRLKIRVSDKTASLEAEINEHRQARVEIQRLNSELEQRVAERTSQLESANKELEAFCYSVSHDLRAPLRHIDGYVDLLISRCRGGLDEKGLHYVDTIASSARQMGILIDDLLQFSRTGRAEMRNEVIDMNQLINEVIEMLDDGSRSPKIEWAIEKLPQVRGDYALIRQVWANLLGNAVKYTRSNETARIEVSSNFENGETVFAVKDNGVGFDMQYVSKLFGVFQRLHSQEQFEGTGIGLATVQRIINRHGGRVWAEGKLNHGAAFYFTLPV